MRAISLALLLCSFGCKADTTIGGAATATSTVAPTVPAAPSVPTTLFKTAKMPKDIAVDASALYVTEVDINDPNEAADILRIPLDGSARTVLAKAQRAGQSLMATPTSLYWIVDGDIDKNEVGSVMRLPLGGGKPAKVASTIMIATAGLAHDQDAIYFAEQETSAVKLKRLAFDGADATEVASIGNDTAPLIAVDKSNVYWTRGTVLLRAPKTGGSPTEVAPVKSAAGLAVDATHIYWTDKGDGPPFNSGSVQRLPLTGGPVETIAAGLTLPWGIALDDTDVYWVNNADRNGSVMRRAKAGGPVSTLVTAQDAPVQIALDAHNVYWTNAGDGTVRKLTK